MQQLPHDEAQPISRAQEKDWIAQSKIMYGGLAGLGLVMMNPFMYQGEFTGLPAKICVISFAVSTPILAALLLLNHEEAFRRRINKSRIAQACKALALLASTTGFVAAFWHIDPFTGKVAIAGCALALIAHSAGYAALYTLKNKKG